MSMHHSKSFQKCNQDEGKSRKLIAVGAAGAYQDILIYFVQSASLQVSTLAPVH